MSDLLPTRNRVNALASRRNADDPVLVDARRDHAAAKLEAAITRIVADAPPLTTEQADRLAGILIRGGAR
jgi:hypothetical protein